MKSKHFESSMTRVSSVLAVALMLVSAASASTTQVIYSFAGGNDGEYADTELVIDSSGNLYGTTVQGGASNAGTVFELSPSGSGWTHTVLYSFTGGADGGEPYKGVTLDTHGNLYGTTVVGGKYLGPCVDTGCGVVYKLTKSGSTWRESVIHSFTGGSDGYGPGSPVIFDKAGNLYGMTPTGGSNACACGVIYQLKPGANGNWTLNVIHTFTGGADGATGSAGRLLLTGGGLYGAATVGGANAVGTVFELTLTSGGWQLTTLYAFKDQPDAALPYGGLVSDGRGHLYGTTYYAGANDIGAVYRLTHGNGTWSEVVLHSFQGGTDGSSPISTLVSDANGNLYGTTSEGGAGCSCGIIFKLVPGTKYTTYSVSYRFQGAPDGAFAYNGMVSDGMGNFYGATVHGGTGDNGAIYKFTP